MILLTRSISAGIALTLATAFALASTPDSEGAADAATGKTLFSQNCARCHGFNMANPAPGVFDLRTFPPDDKARFLAAVSEGKGAMPAWKSVLSPAEIESLWSYVESSH